MKLRRHSRINYGMSLARRRRWHTSPAYDQDAFQFLDDDGSLTAATLLGTLNSNQTLEVDTNYRIRFVVQETNNKAVNNIAFALYYNHEGAGWLPAPATADGSPVYLNNDANSIADNATTAQRIGSGTYVTGDSLGYSDGTTDVPTGLVDFGGNDEVELEFCFQIDSTQVADEDTIQLRVELSDGTDLNVYTSTPTATVNKAATPQTITGVSVVSTPSITEGTLANVPPGGAVASDDFTDSDGTTLEDHSANWESTYAPAHKIYSNTLEPRGGGAEEASAWTGDSFNDDQYSQVVEVDGSIIGPAVRITVLNTDFYGYYWSASYSWIFKVDGGTWTQLGAVDSQEPTTSDVVRLESEGTTLRVTIAGSPSAIGDKTDTSFSSGYAGICSYGSTVGSAIDDWEGGNLGASAQTITGVSVANSPAVTEGTLANVSAQTITGVSVVNTPSITDGTLANGTAQTITGVSVVNTPAITEGTLANVSAQTITGVSVVSTPSITEGTLGNDSAQTITGISVVNTPAVTEGILANSVQEYLLAGRPLDVVTPSKATGGAEYLLAGMPILVLATASEQEIIGVAVANTPSVTEGTLANSSAQNIVGISLANTPAIVEGSLANGTPQTITGESVTNVPSVTEGTLANVGQTIVGISVVNTPAITEGTLSNGSSQTITGISITNTPSVTEGVVEHTTGQAIVGVSVVNTPSITEGTPTNGIAQEITGISLTNSPATTEGTLASDSTQIIIGVSVVNTAVVTEGTLAHVGQSIVGVSVSNTPVCTEGTLTNNESQEIVGISLANSPSITEGILANASIQTITGVVVSNAPSISIGTLDQGIADVFDTSLTEVVYIASANVEVSYIASSTTETNYIQSVLIEG